MSAKKSGGTAARKRAKDSEMAAMMKAKGIKRSTMKCPMCHKQVGIESLFKHLGSGGCH